MQSRTTIACIAGLMAGIFHNMPGGGAMFALMPFLPLLLLGLYDGTKQALNAGFIAILTSMFLGRDQSPFNMAVFIVLPCIVLLSRLLRYKIDENGKKVWYSALRSISDLTLVCAGLLMAISFMVTLGHKESLSTILQSSFKVDLATMEPETAAIMRKLTGEWSFMFLVLSGWVWVIATWLLTLLSNQILKARYESLRPDIALEVRGVPHWFIALLGISAIMALFGQPNDSFIGRALFLILLLPYFLSGLAALHRISAPWKPRKFWLLLIYIVMLYAMTSYPLIVIFVALAGLYYHLVETLDKPQKMS